MANRAPQNIKDSSGNTHIDTPIVFDRFQLPRYTRVVVLSRREARRAYMAWRADLDFTGDIPSSDRPWYATKTKRSSH